jgi:RHS repeat-associated protein
MDIREESRIRRQGLDYYRARYYDPANGRFISVDPAGFGAGDTNLYRYVGNRSTMYTDPTGMLEFKANPFVDVLSLGSFLFNNTIPGIFNRAISGVSAIAGNGAIDLNPFDKAKAGVEQLQQLPGFKSTKIDVKFDAGEKYGDAAAQYYSQKFNDPNTPLWQKPAYLGGGLFSSLWTTDTSTATFDVLSTALLGAKDIQKFGLWAEGKYAGLKLGGAFDGLTKFERTVEGGISRATSVSGDIWRNYSQQLKSKLNSIWERI